MGNQLKREIEELSCRELFRAYHEDFSGHTLFRHVGVSKKELINRIGNPRRWEKEEIVPFSRFYGGEEECVRLIHECLAHSEQEIASWVGKEGQLVLVYQFSEPIGEALVLGTDWNTMFPASCIRVVLIPHKRPDRLFLIKTAYPSFSMDEVDAVWDAKDEWFSKNKKS